MPSDNIIQSKELRSRQWRNDYRTSAALSGGRAVDILHDFYIPALSLSKCYDRVAGYFSSSSLAAASQGFSAFVGKEGAMRLIVGADIAPHDVESILAGDREKYTTEIEKHLGEPDSWPEDVKNGVELLCWMVARGYLEVRVAFRVHSKTHQPLPPDAVEDGYVHEKWAVFWDAFDNRLLASGSLNESRTALTRNAENLDIHCDWWGERDRQRVDDAQRDFENLWHDRHDHFRVLTLPEAVHLRLIKIGETADHPTEIDGTSAVPPQVDPPSALERLKFAIIQDGPKLPGGRMVGIETAPVEPWPHQSVVARRLVDTWPYSYMLCDEVGLGKTIEAGLAMRSLYLSGLVKRILIAPPASLKKQWQREMAKKFLMPFARTETSPTFKHYFIHPFEDSRPGRSLYGPELNIVSRNMLEREDRRRDIKGADSFDIVLVDEAHAARRQNPTENGEQQHAQYGKMYHTLQGILRDKAEALWLATATPMQLERIEAWDLLRLTRRAGPFGGDPSLTFQYYDLLAQLMQSENLDARQWEFLRQGIISVKKHDQVLWQFIEDAVIDARLRVPVKKWLERELPPRGSDCKRMIRLIFAAAPLSRVMLRHSRQLLEIYRDKGKLSQNLAKREILPIPKIEFSTQEQKVYDALEMYCEELNRQINRCSDGNCKSNLGFYKSFLRLRFASGFRAIRTTVARRRQKVRYTINILDSIEEPDRTALEEAVLEAEEEQEQKIVNEAGLKGRSEEDLRWELERLEELERALEKLRGPSRKMKELLRELNGRRKKKAGRIQQTVIFTRFVDTLNDIVQNLIKVDSDILIGTYSGQGGGFMDPRRRAMVDVDREDVKGLFMRDKIDLLVCTDAAAEGLNLQTADMIINYDLPWNPMKVEQRIGRLDRIGQIHKKVKVLNLCYLGSSEEIVYGRLLRRLHDAEKVVGTQQMTMLPVTSDDFRKLADGELGEDELKQKSLEKAKIQRERTSSMEISPKERYNIYMNLQKKRAASGPPVDLNAIWSMLSQSRYLKDLGCIVGGADGEKFFDLNGVENLPEKTKLTASRILYEKGFPEGNKQVNFTSYGDRCFDTLLAHLTEFKLPECIRRLSVDVDGIGAEVVGYAAACESGDGRDEVRFIQRWEDLEGLKIAEESRVCDDDVERLKDRLQKLARDEFSPARTVRRVENINIKAGISQICLVRLVARNLISSRSNYSKNGDMFWAVKNDIDRFIAEEREISITHLPVDKLRLIQQESILSINLPSVGHEASILAPTFLLQCAVDAACREAEALKKKQSKVLTAEVCQRLTRSIERDVKELGSM